jgi:hypothetical protein
VLASLAVLAVPGALAWGADAANRAELRAAETGASIGDALRAAGQVCLERAKHDTALLTGAARCAARFDGSGVTEGAAHALSAARRVAAVGAQRSKRDAEALLRAARRMLRRGDSRAGCDGGASLPPATAATDVEVLPPAGPRKAGVAPAALLPAPFLSLAYGYLPLVWGDTLATYEAPLMQEAGTVLQAFARMAGAPALAEHLPALVMSPGAVGFMQGSTLLGSAALSLALTRRVAGAPWASVAPQALLICAFTAELWRLVVA